jgi:pimeloyl-ACP methyl ester carboxylesterase
MTNAFEEHEKPHLVFIHGGGVGPWMWSRQVEHFERRFCVHLPVLPGHAAGVVNSYTSHVAAAHDIAEQIGLRSLKRPITVVGFSIGGQVAITLATLNRDRVDRVVVASSLLQATRGSRLAAVVGACAAPLARSARFSNLQAKSLGIQRHHLSAYLDVAAQLSIRTVYNMLRSNLQFAMPEQFLQARLPVLFLTGSDEQRLLRREASRVANLMIGGTYGEISDAGHGAPFTRPVRFNALLDGWMSRTSDQSPDA